MLNRVILSVYTVLVAICTTGVLAEEGKETKAGTTKKAARPIDLLKSLEGKWVGKASHGGPKSDTTVTYRITAAGNTVIETLFEGTDHEMVTMYHQDGDNLILTHYCAAGNQPRMKAKKSDDGSKLVFEFLDGTNMDPTKDFHMHEGTIWFVDGDHLKAEWVSFGKGKRVGAAEFELTRKKS